MRREPRPYWPARTYARLALIALGSANMRTGCLPNQPESAERPQKLQPSQYDTQMRRERMRIVILGPGETQPPDLRKREQIMSRLRERGYSLAILGEELLEDADAPLHLALRSELPNIDLLLVLNTGVAPIVELTAISFDHRARQVTKVWSKREYVEGRRTTPGDLVAMFENWPFNEEEFDSCELVEWIIATAERFCLSKAQQEGRLTSLGLLPPD